MPQEELSAKDRAVLIALAAQARKVSNPELEQLIGFRLEGKHRVRLNDMKLVESEKPGRAYEHELSDAGWRWCAEQLAAGPQRPGTSLERAQQLFFGVFARYMNTAGLSLADVVTGTLPTRPAGRHQRSVTVDVHARVTDAYLALAAGDGAFVKLRELRQRLADVPRAELDAALTAMFTARRANLIPQSNQQALTAADRGAALHVGGEYKHLISIG